MGAVGAVGVEISAFPLTWHIAYTTACCYRTSRDVSFTALCSTATLLSNVVINYFCHVGELEEAGEEGEIQLSWWTRNLKYAVLFQLNTMITDGVVAFRLIAFRLITPPVGSTAELQPKSN